jgi:hypothetical protein
VLRGHITRQSTHISAKTNSASAALAELMSIAGRDGGVAPESYGSYGLKI